MSLPEALLDLQRLTERLRRECPWDREQTAATIVPHTIEEAYEVADAALAGADEELLDELGDLLFQVFFLALTLEERGRGDLERVARTVRDKLVRRHPHVFGSAAELDSAGDVRLQWDDIKRGERGRKDVFHDVPENLPALLYARKAQRRAAAVGFEYVDVAGALADLESELAELRAELDGRADPPPESPPNPAQAAELGDVLFACVNVARRLNVDPELELRRATRRFVERVEHAGRIAEAEGLRWSELPLEHQDAYYERAKGER